MKKALLASALALLFAGTAQAQQTRYNYNTQKVGKQVTTTIEPVTPPPPLKIPAGAVKQKDGEKGAGKDPGELMGKGVVLAAKDWRCGREFTDENGNRYRLISGQPLNQKPAQVPGWILQTTDGRNLFLTTTGSLYRRGN